MSFNKTISFLYLLPALIFLGCSVSKNVKVDLIKSVSPDNDSTKLIEYYSLRNYGKTMDLHAFDSVAIWNGLEKAKHYRYFAKQYYKDLDSADTETFLNATATAQLQRPGQTKILEYVFKNGIFINRIDFIRRDTLHNAVKTLNIVKKPINIQMN